MKSKDMISRSIAWCCVHSMAAVILAAIAWQLTYGLAAAFAGIWAFLFVILAVNEAWFCFDVATIRRKAKESGVDTDKF